LFGLLNIIHLILGGNFNKQRWWWEFVWDLYILGDIEEVLEEAPPVLIKIQLLQTIQKIPRRAPLHAPKHTLLNMTIESIS
jgi:hypothetical protein